MSTKTVPATLLAALISVTGLTACSDTAATPGSSSAGNGGGNHQKM